MNLPDRTAADADLAKEKHCWFSTDRVANDAASTEWKRRARLRQAIWREARALPIGTEPHGKADGKRVDSRINLAVAKANGANFLTPGARQAAVTTLQNREPHETLQANRLWADLLSSMPLCFNLFGDLTHNPEAAARAVQAWWADAPQGTVHVQLEHSPGRRDPEFLGNRSAFDVAFEIAQPNGKHAIIGVETKYHEHARAEAKPQDAARARYEQVTERAGVFYDGWQEQVIGTPLQQIWLDHLLVLAMLQHPSGKWSWGRFVLVYPAENPSFAAAAARYRQLLRDTSTFEARTIEELLRTPGALDAALVDAFAERYLVDSDD